MKETMKKLTHGATRLAAGVFPSAAPCRKGAVANQVPPVPFADVSDKIITVRGENVMLDADVAALYGVTTREVNQAVRRNPGRFLSGYIIELEAEETKVLRSHPVTANCLAITSCDRKISSKSRYNPKAFTEKGLYMLATILKSPAATAATLAIVETFAKVRSLKKELVELHKVTDKPTVAAKLKHFGEALADIVMPDLKTSETESTLELNFLVGKLKHTVRRKAINT